MKRMKTVKPSFLFKKIANFLKNLFFTLPPPALSKFLLFNRLDVLTSTNFK